MCVCVFVYIYIHKYEYYCSFLGKTCGTFYHQYLDIFRFAFICKTCKIMFTYNFFLLFYIDITCFYIFLYFIK